MEVHVGKAEESVLTWMEAVQGGQEQNWREGPVAGDGGDGDLS